MCFWSLGIIIWKFSRATLKSISNMPMAQHLREASKSFIKRSPAPTKSGLWSLAGLDILRMMVLSHRGTAYNKCDWQRDHPVFQDPGPVILYCCLFLPRSCLSCYALLATCLASCSLPCKGPLTHCDRTHCFESCHRTLHLTFALTSGCLEG